MKLHRLKMEAFGPYKRKQEINFKEFEKQGLFLITGETGSGKTTIFDAISFVLYGDVSGRRKEIKTLKSDFSDFKKLCFVELEFNVHGKKYFIKRIPDQLILKKNKDGVKQQKHQAELILPNGEVKTNLKEISNIIVNEILKVDKENFNKLVMLPQGQFQKLLTEKGEEQVNTFRKLFGTKIYEEIANKLFEEKQKIKKRYEFKVDENSKKMKNIIFDEELNVRYDVENLDFSESLDVLLQHNLKNKEELKKIEDEIGKEEDFVKQLEVKLSLAESFMKKKREKEELEKDRAKINVDFKELDKFQKIKKILDRLENLNIYYLLWKGKENKIQEKDLQIKQLEQDLKKQECLKNKAFLNFTKIDVIENELKKEKDKQNNFVVMFNNYNLAQQNLAKIKSIKKDLTLLDEKKSRLHKAIKIKQMTLNLNETKILNSSYEKLIEFKKKFNILQKRLENLNIKYLSNCEKFYEQQAFNLAKGLKKGEACPVCGSVTHPRPKSDVFSSVSEDDLKILQKEIFNEKDRLNLVDIKIKEIVNNLAQSKIVVEDLNDIDMLEDMLKDRLKKEKEEEMALENDLKNLGLNFNLSLEFNYEEEIVKNEVAYEKLKAYLSDLEEQNTSFLKDIPLCLQKKDNLLNYKNDIIKNIKSLEERINLILKTKEQEEKKLNELIFRYDNISSNLDEIKKEAACDKANFFNKLKDVDITFEKFLEYHKKFKNLKEFTQNIETRLKKIEKIDFNIKNLEKDLNELKIYDIKKLLKEKKDLNLKISQLKEREKFLIRQVAVNSKYIDEMNNNLKEIKELEDEFKTAKILSEVAKGSKNRVSFEKYVLTFCLNEVLTFANDWFKKATSNRYCFAALDMQDCLNFNVFDAYSGKIRHVSTLSGGETFAASLALCLGLCGLVSNMFGGIEFNTMLIDEGFGSLDENYLNSIISCLQRLKKRGRQIGIISHIPELKNKIGAQIVVTKTSDHGSNINIKI